jgi:hypothetical protein
MKSRLVIAILCTIALQGQLLAQETDPKPFLTDSSRAVQFAIGDYLGVKAFDGKSVSVKWHVTDRRAWRFGVVYSGYTDKEVHHADTFLDDSLTTSRNSDIFDRALTIEVGGQHLWYFGTRDQFFLYFGAGPLVRFNRDERDYGSSKVTAWTFGGSGTIGVEWFAHHRLSLHSEYVSTLTFRHFVQRTTSSARTYGGSISTATEELNWDRWDLISGKVLFGFSVYF